MGSHELDDAALVARMAEGDREALAILYDRHASTLLVVAHRILGDRREAEDLLHDALLEAWRKAAGFDPARGSVRAWLVVRVRSRALDRRRALGPSRVLAPERFERIADAREPNDGDVARVQVALATLPEDQRHVLELAYFEGLSSSEIAARLSVPMGTVKSRVAAGMAKLRAGLGAQASAGGRAASSERGPR